MLLQIMIKKIDAFIIGSYKAGTTSLKNYLSEHPEIVSHPQLELDSFFGGDINESEVKLKMKKQFQYDKEPKIILGKNTSFYRNTNILNSIKNYNSSSKIIFIVRNPAERAYSSWKMEKERTGIKEDFNDIFKAIEDQESSFIYNSCYLAGLYGKYYSIITEIFEKENIKLIKYENLILNPLEVCQECFDFLKVDNSFEPNVKIIHNKSYKPKNKFLTGLIKSLSSKNNLPKRIIRKVLPYNSFIKIKSTLRNMNQSKTTFPSLDAQTKMKLLKFYASDILLLEKISGIDVKDYKL